MIALAGVVTYIPKVLRSSSGPAYFDELLHLGQAQLLLGGHIFGGNSVVPAVGYYPFMQVLIVATHYVTSLSLWESDLAVVGVFHVLMLLSVFLWVKELSGDERLGGMAALCYLVGPAVLFFSSEASYESVGLPMTVLTLVTATRAARGSRGWMVVAVVLSVITTITQPVSGFFLAGALLLLGVCSAFGRLELERHKQAYPVFLGLGLLAVAINLAWIATFNWSATWTYLFPYRDLLGNLWSALSKPRTGHHAFASSTLPGYERIAGFGAVVLSLAAVVTAVALRHRSRKHDRKTSAGQILLWWSSAILSFGFLISLPLDLSPQALVWVHRSWQFTWLGVAYMLAYLLDRLLSRVRSWQWLSRSAVTILVAGATVTFVVGNTAITTNENYMFPVPYRFGSGTSVATDAQLAAAAWMRAHAPHGARIASDPDTELVQWSYAHETVIGAFPTWLLTFGEVAAGAEAAADKYDLQYLIVDKLMYRQASAQGFVYSPYEPGAFAESRPVPVSAFATLSQVPWLSLVYDNSQMAIFSVVPAKKRR